jgi:phage-related baseplate assembly protein
MSFVPELLSSTGSGAAGYPTQEEPAGASQDIVGVFTQSGEQLFVSARPASVRFMEGAYIAQHPVESGGTISDNRVFGPVEVDITFYVTDYVQTMQRIMSAYKGEELLSVRTMTGIYDNMCIVMVPHDEVPDMAGVVMLNMRLSEVLLVQAQYEALPPAKVSAANDASTKKRGEVTPKKVASGESDEKARGTLALSAAQKIGLAN